MIYNIATLTCVDIVEGMDDIIMIILLCTQTCLSVMTIDGCYDDIAAVSFNIGAG